MATVSGRLFQRPSSSHSRQDIQSLIDLQIGNDACDLSFDNSLSDFSMDLVFDNQQVIAEAPFTPSRKESAVQDIEAQLLVATLETRKKPG